VAMLERATAARPTDASLHKNLGLAYRAVRAPDRAARAFKEALRLEPEFTVAWLNMGAVLDETGQRDESLMAYMRAFKSAEKSGLFMNVAAMPAGVRTLAERAMSALREARAEVFREALAPVAARFGDDALKRVWECLEAYLGKRPPLPLPALQKPTLMTFPGVPGRAWFEREMFPWLTEIERQTDAIREELTDVLASDEGFRPFVEIPVDHPGAAYWRQVNHSPSWNAFFFYRDGGRHAVNHARCPVTSAALDALPLIRIAEHSPESFYSVLAPGAYIPPHTGVINCRLVVHLPLIVPPDCGIRVGSETRGWEEGRCIAFDDTFEHEAWNRSERTRVVLIFDIWNPYLSEAEREGMRAAVEALGLFNRGHGDGGESL
ncbi:MAG TPA: aspartyl/asparaginyl beta-hydroxylase domain-containing protein, partial [Gammaproteobacteria bacterium]|nr:aspartyl/asparaginyl beta-hydroxylase domain-containing protein [Gammaproteobacteria bacterium]